MASPAFSLFLCLCLWCGEASQGGNVRGGLSEGSDRTVATEEVEASLRDAFQEVLQGGEGAIAKHLETIESRIWITYKALPKNGLGRLGHRAVRYLVHNYFAREHGWQINGLEPHGNQEKVSSIHAVNIIQDKAPALLESLLEAQRGDRGLSLMDTVTMVAALERLVFDESLVLLQASYTLNDLSPSEAINESSVHEVLSSYLLLFEMGLKAKLVDSRTHRKLKMRAAEAGGNWPILMDFQQDAVLNNDFTKRAQLNPFVDKQYTFQVSSEIMEGLASGYGKWQNTECTQMKEHLMTLDPDGKGRVPLSKFYSEPDNADYHFSESMEYLAKIGALDNTRAEPSVRIANYMTGPSNCIASSSYYSVCCLNECEVLMNELEAKVGAPNMEPKGLLGILINSSSASVDAPRQLPQVLTQKLHEIASYHEGAVPLHGRLFAQWMHHAFPNECPYPEITADSTVLTPSHWLDKKTITSMPVEQRQKIVSEAGDVSTSGGSHEITWSDEEVLHAASSPTRPVAITLSSLIRLAMQIALLLGSLSVALSSWRSATGAIGKADKHKSDLPF